MFDQVPVRVWLLIGIAAIASAPLVYLYRFFVGSPVIVGEAPHERGWRTQRQVTISLALLCGLAALAIFIFTPAAANFARSPSFWPIIFAALAAWTSYATLKGLITGSVEPMIRGSLGPYSRAWQPVRYWLSMLWNAGLSGLMIWVASVGGFNQTGNRSALEKEERCFNYSKNSPAEDSLAACNELIASPASAPDLELVDLLTGRGYAYDRLGDHRRALADFQNAVRFHPRQAEGYYDRALSFQQLGDWSRAIDDYSAALRLKPDSEAAMFNRGYAYEHLGDLQHTIADFSAVIRLNPKDAAAYYYRGAAYKDLGEDMQAKSDFESAARLNPRFPAMK